MRVSVLASVCVGALALLAAPAAAAVSDLQCRSGNSNATTGLCATNDDFQPRYNKADTTPSGVSYETDRVYLKALLYTSTQASGSQYDALLDVHRIAWDTSNNGVGNTQRNSLSTIGKTLPAGFLPFPFQMAYTADGFYLEPHTQAAGETVTSSVFDFNYKTKNNSATGGPNQPVQASDANNQIWLLFQPFGEFGFTAGQTSVTGNVNVGNGEVFADGNTGQFGPQGTLPNGGIGTYFLTRRVINAAGGEAVTGNVAVTNNAPLQCVGGPNAPANTYTIPAVSGAADAPVLSNLVHPSPDGAVVTFTQTPIGNNAVPAGKVFLSQAILTVKSVTPVEQSTTGVPFTGTYTLDVTTGTNAAAGTFVPGSQKLYVRRTNTAEWTVLSGSSVDNNNVVSYTLQSGDVPAASFASLEMSVQADLPVSSSSSSSSTGESSSSSSSTGEVSSSSSSSTAEASSSSSSSSSATPSSSSSSSSTGAPSSSSSSSTAAVVSSSSSSSSTGSTIIITSSSSSTAVPQVSSSSSSSSTGDFFSSSSSSTGDNSGFNNGAVAVGANGAAVVLAAAAAVAALYA